MALKIEIIKRKSNSYELQAIVVLQEFENSNISLSSLPDSVKMRLEQLPRKSVGSPSTFYKCIFIPEKSIVEFYHLNSTGEPDRLVAIVKDDGKEYNPFNF